MTATQAAAFAAAAALAGWASAFAEETAALPDDATIDRFISVRTAIADIRRTAAPEVGAQPEPDERSRLRAEAQARMRQIAETEGLTVADYNRLVALMQENPEFRAQVERSRR